MMLLIVLDKGSHINVLYHPRRGLARPCMQLLGFSPRRFTCWSRESAVPEEVDGLVDDFRIIHDESVAARHGKKVRHSVKPRFREGNLAVVFSVQQSGKRVDCLVSGNDTYHIVDWSELRSNAVWSGPQLLTGRPSGGPEQLTVSEPIRNLAALIRRGQHHHVSEVDVEIITGKKGPHNDPP